MILQNRNKFLFLLVPVFTYLVFMVFSDSQKILDNLLAVNIRDYLLFVGFWSLGVLARIIRWHLYMRRLESGISFARNTLYFLAGMSMLLSPGRLGEVIRSPLIKRDYGVPVSKTASVVLVERFHDMLASVLIISLALVAADLPKTILAVPVAVVVAVTIVVLNKKLIVSILQKMKEVKLINRAIPYADESFETASDLLKPRRFVVSALLTMGVVLSEAVGFYFLLNSLGVSTLDFATLTAILHSSSFLGAVSLVPAGFGVVEAGLSGLLLLNGVSEDVGFGAAVLLRIVATGLFSVIGLVCLKALRPTGK